ncbi:MAG: hypothetical protein ACI8QY_000976, partial [bacterium]
MNCNRQKNIIKAMLMLGGVFLLAVWLVKPIGVSTQFVIADGIVWDAINPEIVTVNESTKSG